MTPHSVAVLIAHLALAVVGVWLIAIDARTHRLPNRIVLPALGALIVILIIEALATGSGERLTRSLLGGLALGAFFAVLRLSSRRGMGGGDVKLAAAIGLVLAWHGWSHLLLGAAAAFLLGALHALMLMALRRATRHTRIAFGPWMIIGAVLAIGLA